MSQNNKKNLKSLKKFRNVSVVIQMGRRNQATAGVLGNSYGSFLHPAASETLENLWELPDSPMKACVLVPGVLLSRRLRVLTGTLQPMEVRSQTLRQHSPTISPDDDPHQYSRALLKARVLLP